MSPIFQLLYKTKTIDGAHNVRVCSKNINKYMGYASILASLYIKMCYTCNYKSHKKVESVVLVVDREGKQQLIYYVNHSLIDLQ